MKSWTYCRFSGEDATHRTCAVHSVGITFTTRPPFTTPTLKETSRSMSVAPSIVSIREAMARMALRPTLLSAPAWAGLPCVFTV